MKTVIKKKRKSKRDLYYEEAHSLFIIGWDLQKIEETIPVSQRTLKKWQSVGQWARKKELVMEHPKLMGEALKSLVQQKVKALLNSPDEININKIDELNKIIGLLERIEEHCWDEKAAVVEVMGIFGNFVRRQVGEHEELQFLVTLMEKFFEEIEGT